MSVKPSYSYRAEVLKVTDGDTLVVRFDAGFRVWVEAPVRLNGLNAPERYTAAGKETAAWVFGWLRDHPDIVVTTEKDPEKYGRWLGTITAVDDGSTLNEAMIADGRALPYSGRGPMPVWPDD